MVKHIILAMGLSLSFIAVSCKHTEQTGLSKSVDGVNQQSLANDPFRPQFHLLPAKNWMNDPTGPIYVNGAYHLFYQYNPYEAVWGNMSWGHAESPDLIHWRHRPVAIEPTPNSYDDKGVFSGHIVMKDNKAYMFYTGVSVARNKDDVTLHDKPTASWAEVQAVAVSTDGLKSWQKWSQPVLPKPPIPARTIAGWRDPVVWYNNDERAWDMIVGGGVMNSGGGRVFLYRSPDLAKWNYIGIMAEGKGTGAITPDPVDSADMWECPDVFPMGKSHVLVYAALRKIFWQSGTLRNDKFVANGPEKMLDYGRYYATRSQLDKDGNRILWGWIMESARRTEDQMRASGWSGVMALPRLLTLGSDGALRMDPAPVVDTLRKDSVSISLQGVQKGNIARANTVSLADARISNLAADMVLTLPRSGRKAFELNLFSQTTGEKFLTVSYSPSRIGKELMVNETAGALIATSDESPQIRVILDGSVVETFLNHRSAITERVYTDPLGDLAIDITDQSAVQSFDIYGMNPISSNRLTN